MSLKWSPGCQCCGPSCSCGSALWVWDDTAEEWGVDTDSCTGDCVPIEPTSPGTVDLEEKTTCCAFGCFGDAALFSTPTPSLLTDAEVASFSIYSQSPAFYTFVSRTALTTEVTYTVYDTASCRGWKISSQLIEVTYYDISADENITDNVNLVIWTMGQAGYSDPDYIVSFSSYIYIQSVAVVYPVGSGFIDTDAALNNAVDINYLAISSTGNPVTSKPYPGGIEAGYASAYVTSGSSIPTFTEDYANLSSLARFVWVENYSCGVA